MKLLDGKVGIITGGTSGVGKVAAILFAEHGAKMVVTGRNEKRGLETVEQVKAAGGEAFFFPCDVSNEEEVKAMVAFTIEKFGKLDWAFNNAGVSSEEAGLLHETTTAAFDSVIKTNLYGVYYCMKYEIPHMLQAGAGAIVNTLSINSVRTTPGGVSYGSSKYGAYGLTQSAALDYAKQNIRINAIGPGPTKTPMIELSAATHPELISYLESTIPDCRMSDAIEQANAALFLLSDMSKHIVGQLLLVDGGQSCNM